MKPVSVIAAVFGLAVAAHAQSEANQPSVKPFPRKFNDAPTHDTIVKKVQPKPDPITQMPKVEVSEEAKKAEHYKPKSIVDRCHVFVFGDKATLVPKQSVLHFPEHHKSKVGKAGDAKIVPWGEFLAANRGWIRTVEVSREQAEGQKALPEETTLRFKDSSQVIVATHLSGPIAVLPVPEEEETPEGETEKTAEP